MHSSKKVILIAIVALIYSCTLIKKLYVPYSDAKQKHALHKDGVIRIYFDRMGFIYPDVKIIYADFKKNDGRLNQYYSNHRRVYEQLCISNGVVPLDSSVIIDTVGPYEDPLQTAMLKTYINQINDHSNDKELVFIIHGFNEFPIDGRDSSSFKEMKRTRETITKKYKYKNIQFVEIYWDGLSQEGGAKILRPFNSLKIWNNAQVSATHTGLELRRLFSGIKAEKITVITHSHGAGIITTTLFNLIKFSEKHYERENHWLNEVKMKYKNILYDTPKQKIVIGMLAPAIPGENVFREYFQRTELGVDTILVNKNYKFIIGFNENDPITRKFNIAAAKLGSTTLACKPKELLHTENLYNDRNIIDHVDFSTDSAQNPQNDHSWFAYLANKPSIDNFLLEVFK